MEIPVMDVMTTKIVSVKPEVTVIDAVNKMIKQGLGNVLVIDKKGVLKGIVTEKDIIIKVVAKNLDPKEIKISEVMTKNVITTKPTATIQEVTRSMIDKGIRRMPVKKKGEIIGIVTDSDILQVEPGLIDLLVEKINTDPSLSKGGICDVCNSFSRELSVVDKMMVCNKCKKEL
ncbi:CBS domain-containing protein [archaeon]|nr:CBS domain-containing protein [archaeon]